MKKLMLLSMFMSLPMIAAQNNDWKMNSGKQVIFSFPANDFVAADQRYFWNDNEGKKICLNQRGNPVFISGGQLCEQHGKWFVLHGHPFDAYAAIQQEELVCARLGNKEVRRIYHILQARMRE